MDHLVELKKKIKYIISFFGYVAIFSYCKPIGQG